MGWFCLINRYLARAKQAWQRSICWGFVAKYPTRYKKTPHLISHHNNTWLKVSIWALAPGGEGQVGGGGGGNQKGFLREGSASRSNPLPFIHHFDRKCTPFRTPSLEVSSLFNYCKYTIFKIWINYKTSTLYRLFHSRNMHQCSAFEAFLPTEMTDFPTLSCTSTSEIPTL